MDRFHDLIRSQPLAGHILLVNTPDAADIFAVFGILNIPIAGQLIALVPVLASTLAIALACDGGVAAKGPPDPARRKHQVDTGQHVLDSFALMLNPASVQQKA